MKNKFKLLLIICVILTTFLTIGYATFGSNISISTLTSFVRIEKNIRITSAITENQNNSNVTSLNFDVDSILADIQLLEASSTITFKIEITNLGSTEVGIHSIKGLPDNLDYSFSNYDLNEKICDSNNKCNLGIKKDIYLIIKYKENKYDNTKTKYSIKADFIFEHFHNVDYMDITDSNNYKNYGMNNATFSEKFTEEVVVLDVKMNGILLSEEEYSFDGYNISIPNVSGDLEIISLDKYTFMAGIEFNHLIKGVTNPHPEDEDFYTYYSTDDNRIENHTIRKIIFGKYEDYYDKVKDLKAEPIDVKQKGTINFYRQTESTGTEIVYILSDTGRFIMNPHSAWLFDKLYVLESIINLHILETDNVINMRDLFCDCAKLKDIDMSNFNTSKVEDMIGMFARDYALEYLDLMNFDVSSIKKISSIFSSCTSLKTIYVSNSFKFSNKLTDGAGMFTGATKLVGGNGTEFNSTKVNNTMAFIDGTTPGYFTSLYNLADGYIVNNIIKGKTQTEIDAFSASNRYGDTSVTSITFGQTRDYYEMLSEYTRRGVDKEQVGGIRCYKIQNNDGTYSVYIISNTGKFITSKDIAWLFDKLYYLKDIHNLDCLDTSKATNMRDVFCDTTKLKNFDLSNFNTENATDMTGMFARMYEVESLDLSNFNTSKTTIMTSMFSQTIDSEMPEEYKTSTQKLTTIYVSNLWTTASVQSRTLFANNINLVGGAGTIFSSSNVSVDYARVDTPTTPGYFTLKKI